MAARGLDGSMDARIRDLLKRAKIIAVVGIKAGIEDDAYRVPRYLQEQGYRIVPVNPKLDSVLGERAVSALAEIPDAVDIVNLFRAPPHVPAHVDEILALPKRPRAVWMQLGIAHEEGARQLIAEGVEVIQNRCLMVDHRRLSGPG
jgi:predicted CoA-binding protein